jgi:hypothetical protein
MVPAYRGNAHSDAERAGGRPHPKLPEEGMPFFLDGDEHLERTLNRFLEFLRADGMEISSVEDYATDLLVLSRFLAIARGKKWWEATSEDIRAYREERLHGPLNVRMEK